jgi:hypothetical protein
MPYFTEMVEGLWKIEQQEFIEVEGVKIPLKIKVGVVGDKSFMWKFTTRGQGSSSGSFCWMCRCTATQRHKGQPGGCKRCKRLALVWRPDGTQRCLHHDIACAECLSECEERLEFLRKNITPTIPLTARPVWRNVEELRCHCLLRASDGDKTAVKQMREAELQDFILAYTRRDCSLGESMINGVRKCSIHLVKEALATRSMGINGSDSDLRDRLEARLQVEDEYLGLEAANLDTRFACEEWSAVTDPMLHLIDVLHLPMRTNEHMLHMLKLKLLERYDNKKDAAEVALTHLDILLRDMGGLGIT